jgi:tetratricopeptide (TPR) repeat protein
MKIEKIVAQLKEKDYNSLCDQFTQSKADKYLTLLNHYRTDKTSDNDIQKELDIKTPAFYTLKSRLYDKIQEFLYKSTRDTRIELLQNVANIEHLIYKAPKETAIGLIQKMETELIKNDMPNELITVYKALKKLHVYSSRYYDYQQLYNKFVAYNLAQDKAEEILSSFCKTLTTLQVTRDPKLFDILVLYKKEMQSLCRIHQSHRLTVHKNILTIHFALFCPIAEELVNDDTVEDLLKATYAIIEANPEDSTYIHLVNVVHFLSFEYYNQLKLYKNAASYYEKIEDENSSFLLYNHSCFSFHFLISRIHWHYMNKTIDMLNEKEEMIYEPGPEDITEYIIFKQYKAFLYFYKGKIAEAVQTLNKLINEVSFKDILHAEIEVKLFQVFLLLMAEKSDQAEITLRSISRKISDEDDEIKYHAALLYIKLFKTVLANKANGKQLKLTEIWKLISVTNTGPDSILPNLHLSAEHLLRLSKL